MNIIDIKNAITLLQRGSSLIILDDDDRENEGDLFIPAEVLVAAHVNFMATFARGLICISLPEVRLKKLGIPLMVKNKSSEDAAAFHVSCDAIQGVASGISAFDRAVTMKRLIDADAICEDFVLPGHVFPLAARSHGVLERRGHTEASADLAALAGFKPSGVIVEIMSADGAMARGAVLEKFSSRHRIPIVTIKDLVEYRLVHGLGESLYSAW